MSINAVNPIMPGFYPDPSICGVGEDFYLVNSTFAYFPGLPVFHSKDLVHWKQIGNAMDRVSQLPLKNAGHSQGLFAPTIRYNDGTYYIICTNVSYGGNFVITAQKPEGPWSEPYYLEGADGIDPSLFFDEDGKCYYIGTHENPEGCRYNGDYFIWIQELDLKTMKLVGEKHNVWNGAMKQIVWPEGPHLYKIDGYYYIMHAEGGTGPEHAVTICRSKNIMGPYQNNFCNPILTHRHLGKDYPIKYVGHADLVQTVNNEWYMVMLAVRPKSGYTTMGRETFLAKVTWENGWPVVNVGHGMLTDTVEIDLPNWDIYDATKKIEKVYDFTQMNELGHEFLMLRNPKDNMYVLSQKEGLELLCGTETLKEKASPSYVCVRQQHHHFSSSVTLETQNLSDGKKAGIAYMQSNDYHLRVEVDKEVAELILCQDGKDEVLGKISVDGESALEIQMMIDGLEAQIEIMNGKKEKLLTSGRIDIRALSTEVAGGFVGCTVGMYAVSDKQTDDRACFKAFTYRED